MLRHDHRVQMSNRLPANYAELLANLVSALPEVRVAYLFGSRAYGLVTPESDLDVAVLVDDQLAVGSNQINRTLRRLIGKLSGEISSTLLDLVLLNNAPVLLRHRVLRDGLLLYARSEVERVGFACQTIRDYCDMEPRLTEFRRQRISRLKNGRRINHESRDILKAAQRLDTYLERVQHLGTSSEAEFVATPAIHDLAERYLHLAMEAALDLVNHWISEQALRTPDSNRDTFSVLEESGEIDASLAERLRAWAGFRNILVHEYVNIDHGITYRAIQDDLNDLIALRTWAAGKL